MATFNAGQKIRAGQLNGAVDGLAPVAVTFNTGWGNFGGSWAPLRVSLRGTYALLTGMITATAAQPASGSAVCTLPSAYRPTAGTYSLIASMSNYTVVRLDITTAGVLSVIAAAAINVGDYVPISFEWLTV